MAAIQHIDEHPLYWRYSDHPLVRLALSMVPEAPSTSYIDVARSIHPYDPITMLIIMYTMLRVDGKVAYFYVHEGTLYLYTDMGFVGVDIGMEDVDDDVVDDADVMYPQYVPNRDSLVHTADIILSQLPHSIPLYTQ